MTDEAEKGAEPEETYAQKFLNQVVIPPPDSDASTAEIVARVAGTIVEPIWVGPVALAGHALDEMTNPLGIGLLVEGAATVGALAWEGVKDLFSDSSSDTEMDEDPVFWPDDWSKADDKESQPGPDETGNQSYADDAQNQSYADDSESESEPTTAQDAPGAGQTQNQSYAGDAQTQSHSDGPENDPRPTAAQDPPNVGATPEPSKPADTQSHPGPGDGQNGPGLGDAQNEPASKDTQDQLGPTEAQPHIPGAGEVQSWPGLTDTQNSPPPDAAQDQLVSHDRAPDADLHDQLFDDMIHGL